VVARHDAGRKGLIKKVAEIFPRHAALPLIQLFTFTEVPILVWSGLNFQLYEVSEIASNLNGRESDSFLTLFSVSVCTDCTARAGKEIVVGSQFIPEFHQLNLENSWSIDLRESFMEGLSRSQKQEISF
jgi:hypothetical protein